jgi:hypothetical protein
LLKKETVNDQRNGTKLDNGSMTEDKDIRFAQKKVDESWKENAVKAKIQPESHASERIPSEETGRRVEPKTSKTFLNLISSLGYQAMMHLGELPHPETNLPSVNLEAAREMIDLLLALKEKTANQLSPEEDRLISQLVPELQLKFSQKI